MNSYVGCCFFIIITAHILSEVEELNWAMGVIYGLTNEGVVVSNFN